MNAPQTSLEGSSKDSWLFLKKILSPFVFVFGRLYHGIGYVIGPLIPRILPRKIGRYTFVTANRVTLFRVTLAFPIAYLAFIGANSWALTVFIISGLMDRLDGEVARQQYKLGFKDDPQFGAFFDAFLDKIFWCVLMLVFVPYAVITVNHHQWWLTIILVTVTFVAWSIELLIARRRIIRYRERMRDGIDHNLRSRLSGKLKFTLQMIGLASFTFAFPLLSSHWAGSLGMICIGISIPFALISLRQKK